jgi:hypothetical protein
MGRSLRGAITRVNRLAKELLPSRDAIEARVRRMGDDELEWHILRHVQRVAGPVHAHSTPESLTTALAASGNEGFSKTAVKFWSRYHWFEIHQTHGEPELVRTEPEQWRDRRFLGPAMVFECPCVRHDPGNRDGGLFATYEYFVPDRFRNLTPREEQRAGIWVR